MKTKAVLTVVLIFALLLAGCSFIAGDELLALPKPPAKYVKLEAKLNKILETGAYYTSPESGTNRQALQLVDLDGDGVDEAVSFFRSSPGSGQFKVYLHKLIGEEYVEMGTISGNGTAIRSVEYPRINAQGFRSIVVCWKLEGQETKGMTVGRFSKGSLTAELDTEYLSYACSDLDGDGADEVILTVPDGKTGKNIVRTYHFKEGSIRLLSEAPLSSAAKNVGKPKIGKMNPSMTAIFIESSVEPRGIVTDVLFLSGKMIKNATISPETGLTASTYRPAAIPATDINSDGIIEVPKAVLLPGYTDQTPKDARYRIEWNTVSADGELETVMNTYHNYSEEWFFILPDAWIGQVTVAAGTEYSVNYTTFEAVLHDNQRVPIMRIYNFSGVDAERTTPTKDIVLSEATVTHMARLFDSAGIPDELRISEMTLKECFKLIPKDWFSEEYLP